MDKDVHCQHRAVADFAVHRCGAHDREHASGSDGVVEYDVSHDSRRTATEVVLLLIRAAVTPKEALPFRVPEPRCCAPCVEARPEEGHYNSLGTGAITAGNHARTRVLAPLSSSHQRRALRNKVPRMEARRWAPIESLSAVSAALWG